MPQTFPNIHVGHFLLPYFRGSLRISWRESPSSWRCLAIPRTITKSHYLTPWKLQRVWISNSSELIYWFERDVLDFGTKICHGSWLRNLHDQTKQKRAERRGKTEEEETAEEEQKGPVPSLIYVNNSLHSTFPMLKCTSTISNFTSPMVCMPIILTFSTTSRGFFLRTKELFAAKGTSLKKFLMKLNKRLCLNFFSQREWNSIANPIVPCCMLNWRLTFSALLKC